jgi:acyl-CoA reductase-like NAD-dependent aldehyde dehydrogenase
LFFGNELQLTEDYGRIINQRHLERIERLLQGVKIIFGAEINREQKFISPTIVEPDSEDSPIMQEEVFGPVLPVITFENIDEALQLIRRHPDPLVIYVFTKNKALAKKIAEETSSGDMVINEQVLHFGHLHMPIGGKGSSGIGKYQGKYSFDAFSHNKSVMHRSFYPDLQVRYPPYNEAKLKNLKRLVRWFFR